MKSLAPSFSNDRTRSADRSIGGCAYDREMPSPSVKDERHFRQSSRREKVVEHLFVGELLRLAWCRNVDVQILRPEVDAAGYDIVVTRGRTARHVQIKASTGKRAQFPINISLAAQPSGCVVWLVVDQALNFTNYFWYGARLGQRLPDLERFKVARRTTRGADGVRPERPAIRAVPYWAFDELDSMETLARKLLGKLD